MLKDEGSVRTNLTKQNSESKVSDSALRLGEPSDQELIRTVVRKNNPSTNL